jgi:co-chaperonin GroES (HSP10)
MGTTKALTKRESCNTTDATTTPFHTMSHTPGKFGTHKKPSGPALPPLPAASKGPKQYWSKHFLPSRDLVLAELISDFETDLYIPDSALEARQKAIVVAVGPGRLSEFGILIEATVKVGDNVFLQPGGVVIPFEDKEQGNKKRIFRLVGPNEILGTFEDAEAVSSPEQSQEAAASDA